LFIALVVALQSGRAVVAQTAKQIANTERTVKIQTGFKLLRDVVLEEVENLRLVENRAFVYKSAAAALSATDAGESVQLLEKAIGQIDGAVAELQNADVAQQHRMDDLRRLRNESVLALAEVNPSRALALIHPNQRRHEEDKRQADFTPDIESQVLQRGVAKNPGLVLDRAIKSLDGPVSPGLVDTCIALRAENPEMGRQLGSAIVARLRRENPDPHSPAAQAAFALMSDLWSRQRAATLDPSLLDENSIRQLASFVADLLLAQQSPTPFGFTADLTGFAGVLDVYAPSKAAQLRSRLEKLPPQLPFGPADMKELEAFIHAKNYGQAANWARRAPVEVRRYALGRVAQAQIENGQLDQARSFVSSHIVDPEAREEFLGLVASAEAGAAASGGDEAAARKLIPLLPTGLDRLSTLVSLARKAAVTGDKERARSIIEEARALPSDKSEQLRNEIVLAEGCLDIDPGMSVDIIAAHIERLNALLGASAVLDGYFGPECIREGEIRYFSPFPLFPAVVALCDVLGKVALVDSDQALRLARYVAGPELQTLAILTVCRRLISDLATDRAASSQHSFRQDSLVRRAREKEEGV
jgi:hypothetical protein